jgi:hypothetical protein
MERILHKVKGKNRKVVDLTPIERDTEISKSMEGYLTLSKKDLVKIIQYKNDLLIEYSDWVNQLKNDKKKVGQP